MKNNIMNSYMTKILMAMLTAGIGTIVVEYLLIIALDLRGELMYGSRGALELKTAIAVLVGILVFYACMFYMFRDHFRQMRHILDGIENIATGDLKTRIRLDSVKELSVLAVSLNHMTDQLCKLMEEERQQEQMKNMLVTSVAHDLRTPLTSTMGFLQLLKDCPDMEPEDREHYTEIAYHNAARLETLVEDLLSYTKLQQADYQMNLEQLDARKLLEQLLDEFSLILNEEQMEYEILSGEDGVPLEADGKLLARLFENLIQNAIQYGKSGKRLTIKVSQDDENVHVAVINYGEMIPEEECRLIFERFYRLEYSRNSRSGGNGLGLAIAQSIARLHGGDISVKSTRQQTEFHVTLRKKR